MSGESGLGYGQPRTPGQPAIDPALLQGHRRAGGVVFTVVLTLLMVVGAGVMGLVLLASGAPNALVVGLLLAALPVGPLVATYLWLDRYEPEPRALLVLAFGWGALVATAGALILQLLDQFVLGTPEDLSAAVSAPITEEAMKGLFVLLLLWVRRHEIDGVLDGLVYAGLVGVGFAFTENILYLTSAYMGGDGSGPGGLGPATVLFVIRGVFSPFAHPLFTSFVGIGVGIAVTTRRQFWRVSAPFLGYVGAVAAHSLWNSAALLGGGGAFILTYLGLMVPAFLLLVGLAIWTRRREARMLSRALGDCAARGFLSSAEVPWLVRLPARRVARKAARASGGPAAERVMRAYQQQATELGFLHDRYLRGTAPADFVQRGQVMVEHLAELRPYVAFPRSDGSLAGGAR